MKRICVRIATMGVVCLGITHVQASHAAEASCPAAEDVPYLTKKGDTWYSLGGSKYCLDGPGARFRAAFGLHDYNAGRAGPRANELPEGITVCLPRDLQGLFFEAQRCVSGPKPESPPSAGQCVPNASSTANDRARKEGDDGTSAGDMNCIGVQRPPNVLHCQGSPGDPHAVGHTPGDASSRQTAVVDSRAAHAEKESTVTRQPLRTGLVADAAGGVFVPLASDARAALFGPLGFGRIGARLTIGFTEVAVHGYVGGNRETTSVEPVEQYRSTFIAGGGVQVGIPWERGSFRLTPGLEALFWGAMQTREWPAEFKQAKEENGFGMALFGGYARAEYRFRHAPRLRVSLEFALDYMAQRIDPLPAMKNGQAKLLGGVSYVAF